MLRKPERSEQPAPCMCTCPSGTDIRGWIGLIAQRQKLGLSENAVLEEAWRKVVDVNPFPATMGRICPHPCESACNRRDKDGAVSINALERFLGDWALERRIPLEKLEESQQPESVGVIGAGPSGLSFSYQMARRGYQVTVYERHPRPGGMLRYGIPVYRLPEDVLDGEIQRILDLGVKLKAGVKIGRDISAVEIKQQHEILYMGIGAQQGKRLGVRGETDQTVWTGTRYLAAVNSDEQVDLGKRVVVIGGGDVAVDSARAARRIGAEVTILYRRTRAEMPAIARDVEDALLEGIKIDYLVTPVEIVKNGDRGLRIVVRRMELGEPDESGRRRPVPVPGTDYEIPVDSVITAISQQPDWEGLEALIDSSRGAGIDGVAKLGETLWAGGDMLGLNIASRAIFHGRHAAEHAHSQHRGLLNLARDCRRPISSDRIKQDYYPNKAPSPIPRRPSQEWLVKPTVEINQCISRKQFFEEASRCFSCGLCFGCEQCWMYCNPAGYSRAEEPRPGVYYSFARDECEGCGKCIELCPCGYLHLASNETSSTGPAHGA